MHHEHDIFKMGGLRRKKPYLFWTFFFAGVGPFFSKEHILSWAWFSPGGNGWLWACGLLGAFITSLYLFRLVFVVFFGEEKTEITKRSGFPIRVPLIVLSVMSVVGAFLPFPPLIGYEPPSLGTVDPTTGWILQVIGIAVAAFGVYVAYLWFFKKPRWVGDEMVTPFTTAGMRQFFKEGWAFDRVYHVLLVAPFLWLARVNRADFIDSIYSFVAALARIGYGALRLTQTGRLRWYAAGIAFGAILSLGIAVFL
jgi:NADH-quinone oxidoreductase subunit L